MHLTRMAVGSTRRFAWIASMLALSLAIPAAAAGKRPPPSTYWEGQSPEQAAAAILRAGQEAAGKDSWENIAVARVWYLSGQPEQARPILQNYARGGVTRGLNGLADAERLTMPDRTLEFDSRYRVLPAG